MYYFMDSKPKFTGPVSLNTGGIMLDHTSFRFWTTCLVPEIFAIKVGSCVKSACFWPQNFQVRAPRIFGLGL